MPEQWEWEAFLSRVEARLSLYEDALNGGDPPSAVSLDRPDGVLPVPLRERALQLASAQQMLEDRYAERVAGLGRALEARRGAKPRLFLDQAV